VPQRGLVWFKGKTCWPVSPEQGDIMEESCRDHLCFSPCPGLVVLAKLMVVVAMTGEGQAWRIMESQNH